VFRRRFGATVVGLALLALLANTWLTASVFALPGNDKRLPFHLGIFVTGMAFAYASRTPALARLVEAPAVNRALDALGLTILACLIFSAPAFMERLAAALPWLGAPETRLGLRHPGSYGVLCAALVYITLVCEGRFTHRILSSLALRMLGIVSFSLYLFHVVMQNALLRMWHDLAPGSMLFLCNLAASFLVAVVVYSFVERPCLRIGRNWPARSRRAEA
jgi:peptidoglycan/LPS O-acetylase OafA/YrhL